MCFTVWLSTSICAGRWTKTQEALAVPGDLDRWMHRTTESTEMKQGGIEGVRRQIRTITTHLVAMRLGGTPVPIPNTMVKTQAAESTALETVWEGRWLPEPFKKDVPYVP